MKKIKSIITMSCLATVGSAVTPLVATSCGTIGPLYPKSQLLADVSSIDTLYKLGQEATTYDIKASYDSKEVVLKDVQITHEKEGIVKANYKNNGKVEIQPLTKGSTKLTFKITDVDNHSTTVTTNPLNVQETLDVNVGILPTTGAELGINQGDSTLIRLVTDNGLDLSGQAQFVFANNQVKVPNGITLEKNPTTYTWNIKVANTVEVGQYTNIGVVGTWTNSEGKTYTANATYTINVKSAKTPEIAAITFPAVAAKSTESITSDDILLVNYEKLSEDKFVITSFNSGNTGANVTDLKFVNSTTANKTKIEFDPSNTTKSGIVSFNVQLQHADGTIVTTSNQVDITVTPPAKIQPTKIVYGPADATTPVPEGTTISVAEKAGISLALIDEKNDPLPATWMMIGETHDTSLVFNTGSSATNILSINVAPTDEYTVQVMAVPVNSEAYDTVTFNVTFKQDPEADPIITATLNNRAVTQSFKTDLAIGNEIEFSLSDNTVSPTGKAYNADGSTEASDIKFSSVKGKENVLIMANPNNAPTDYVVKATYNKDNNEKTLEFKLNAYIEQVQVSCLTTLKTGELHEWDPENDNEVLANSIFLFQDKDKTKNRSVESVEISNLEESKKNLYYQLVSNVFIVTNSVETFGVEKTEHIATVKFTDGAIATYPFTCSCFVSKVNTAQMQRLIDEEEPYWQQLHSRSWVLDDDSKWEKYPDPKESPWNAEYVWKISRKALKEGKNAYLQLSITRPDGEDQWMAMWEDKISIGWDCFAYPEGFNVETVKAQRLEDDWQSLLQPATLYIANEIQGAAEQGPFRLLFKGGWTSDIHSFPEDPFPFWIRFNGNASAAMMNSDDNYDGFKFNIQFINDEEE